MSLSAARHCWRHQERPRLLSESPSPPVSAAPYYRFSVSHRQSCKRAEGSTTCWFFFFTCASHFLGSCPAQNTTVPFSFILSICVTIGLGSKLFSSLLSSTRRCPRCQIWIMGSIGKSQFLFSVPDTIRIQFKTTISLTSSGIVAGTIETITAVPRYPIIHLINNTPTSATMLTWAAGRTIHHYFFIC